MSLSPRLQKIAESELREDVTKNQKYIEEIREWLQTQSHLNARTDERWLLTFLRGCKFDLQKTKNKIETYYTLKTTVPELFGNRDPLQPEIQELLKLGVCIPLRKTLNNDSQVVFLLHYNNVNSKTTSFMDVMKVILMSLDILINEHENLVISGSRVVKDLQHISYTHMLQITPSRARKIFVCFQDAYPIRHKLAYFINPPTLFVYFYALLKPLMGRKLRNRIKVHERSDLNEIYEIIPRSVLPVEYGGEDGTLQEMAAEWKEKVESYRDWFLEDAKYCSDESKRFYKA